MSDKQNSAKNDSLIVLDQQADDLMKERTEAQRLQYVPAVIAQLLAVLLMAFTLLENFFTAFSLFSQPASWTTLALRQVIYFGVIPLLVLVIVLLIYKPSPSLVSRHEEAPLSLASALLLGLVSAFAYYILIEQLYRIGLINQVSNYLPSSLTIFSPFLRISAGRTLAALIFTVFLPTICLTPLLLGLFLTPLLGSERRLLSLSLTCLLGALLPLDSTAFFAYLLLWTILSQIYLAGSGLITAALACGGYMTTLLYAPTIFNLLSNRLIAWQSTSKLQGTLLIFALLLIVLILGLPGVFHFNLLNREQRRHQLALSLQPHMLKHLEKTKHRSVLSWLLIIIAVILLLAVLLAEHLI